MGRIQDIHVFIEKINEEDGVDRWKVIQEFGVSSGATWAIF
jgi:hypothetical protein